MAEKINIFGIGISGLVGSKITEVLKDKYIFDNLSLDTGVDITDPKTLDVIRNDKEHPIVLHLAALADVDKCEESRQLGKESLAYKINVLGTENVVTACRDAGKKMIYISTDFVFDGVNPPVGGYTEEDGPHPLNWYAETKQQGEEIVKNSGLAYIIARIAYPYRSTFPLKKDFVNAIIERLKNNQQVFAVTDHIMTPTLVDDIALALDKLIETKSSGIFHVVGSESLRPYDAVLKIAEVMGFDKSLISQTTRDEYFKNRAIRPFNLSLNNAKIKKLGVNMKTFEEGLKTFL
ncbi:MAG TPA: SDR family oxidoreductase [Methylomirabilota bacterium]|nr:SDR family oxidoreductase [Methylomirabilota bacterium]